jgi:hypothetical protein
MHCGFGVFSRERLKKLRNAARRSCDERWANILVEFLRHSVVYT